MAEKSEKTEKKPAADGDEKLLPVEALATAGVVPDWELAGLMRAAGWREGKQLCAKEFGTALAKFRKRPAGGGKI